MSPTELGLQIADRCAVADIECEGIAEVIDGVKHYDTRVMLDEREHCSDSVEMARQAIDYALARGLVARHPTLPHMVRVVQQPARAISLPH